jgi:Fe-S-cluster containining protein
MGELKETNWYVGGLHFECVQCGACCSGPGEGYIWVTKAEIQIIADHLKMSPEQFEGKYLKRVGLRTTITEHLETKDCIFLERDKEGTRCVIYSVRPNQCRTWPFWAGNLTSPSAWNRAALKCPGVNCGRRYSFEEIERIKNQLKWWQDVRQ